LAILMLDLDHFKQVNDRFGHQAGDSVLVRTGELIQANLRTTDIAGRYGGEEFIIMLVNPSAEHGGSIFAERLRGGIEQESFRGADDTEFTATMSIGIALIGPDHVDAKDLVADADAALYVAKSRGRNRVAVHGRET
jgi:diguanylate cyclase (GGDEF)-like protein